MTGLETVQKEVILLEQKIKQSRNRSIGKNIREIRIKKGIGQTELVRLLDLPTLKYLFTFLYIYCIICFKAITEKQLLFYVKLKGQEGQKHND